jgi:hypothetical protein
MNLSLSLGPVHSWICFKLEIPHEKYTENHYNFVNMISL